MARVILENIYKTFQQGRGETESPQAVLRRINLTIQDGEFMVLVGPSGCGKSTLLRLIAGLEQLTAGNIWVGDRLVNDLPSKQRDIAMVFQSYALYPHLSVYNNLAFGLRRMGEPARTFPEKLRILGDSFLVALTRSLPKEFRYWSDTERQVDHRVRTVAQLLQIEALLDRLPKQLSGGQKQRVALGRAMARNPQVFLMDEPLSNLDAKLRTETRGQIVKLQRQLGKTTIYVTHDQVEAMTMGDRIAVMNGGQIQQIAPPLELYHHPVNRFVAEFIGSPPMNFLSVQVQAPTLVVHPQFRFTLPEHWAVTLQPYHQRTVLLGIRPEHLNLGSSAVKNLPVLVERVEALGSETYITARLKSDHSESPVLLQARIDPQQSVQAGSEVWLAIAVEQIHLFDPDTEQALFPQPRPALFP